MKIGIGIDTGGTYTDAVLYDFDTGTILGTAKALTTKNDLTQGILGALDALPIQLVRQAAVLSLSTTLATNACVEGKGGRAKLVFFGGYPKVIRQYGAEYGLPPIEEISLQQNAANLSGEIEKEPDWPVFLESLAAELPHLDGVAVVELNAARNGGVVEKKAKQNIQAVSGLPVICGHELFDDVLGILKRGSSALLNAKLFVVIQEFLNAIHAAMVQRGIQAPVVIVRSDGSLMSDKFANLRPVETLLCGPAAGVLGCTRTGGEKNHIIVDMGGTTTDIALVHNGQPVTATNGVSIGRWKTYVNGLYIKTVGLGGDTAIHYNDTSVYLEEYRVIPLCVLASRHPEVLDGLRKLVSSGKKHTKFLHEYYTLVKEITDSEKYTQNELHFCNALKNGPKIFKDAAESMPGKDIYSLDVSRLIREGVVQVSGLTPTDIMHIKGDFSTYCTEASLLGAQYVAQNINTTVAELGEMVYDQIKKRIYQNLVKSFLENKETAYMKNGFHKDVERFISESYEIAKGGQASEYLSLQFTTDFVLTGVGAPIRIFLEDVAALLGTKAVFPEHYEVANALGAVVGNVQASCAVEIKPNYSTEGIDGYTVFGSKGSKTFQELEEAERYAVQDAREAARESAVERGAVGEIALSSKVHTNQAKTKNSTVYLGSRVVAEAIGAFGFDK